MPLNKEELIDFAKKGGIEIKASAKTKEIEDILVEALKASKNPVDSDSIDYVPALKEVAESIGIEVPEGSDAEEIKTAILGAFVTATEAAAANVPPNSNTAFSPNDAALKVCDPAVKKINISGLNLHAFPEDPLTEFFIFKNENEKDCVLRAGGKAISIKGEEIFVVTKSAQNALKGYKTSGITYLGRKAQG